MVMFDNDDINRRAITREEHVHYIHVLHSREPKQIGRVVPIKATENTSRSLTLVKLTSTPGEAQSSETKNSPQWEMSHSSFRKSLSGRVETH